MNKVYDFEHIFGIGDKVFAKVKGYPHWPARIMSVESKNAYNVRYHVHFYGTNQKGVVKAENVCHYLENKSKYGKLKKNKNFIEALVEIERDLYQESQQEESESAQFSPASENISEMNTAEQVSQSNSPEDSLKRKLMEPTLDIEDPYKKKSRNLPDLGTDADKVDESSITISETQFAPGNNNTPNVDSKKNDSADEKEDFILASINESENVKIPLKLNSPDFSNEKNKTEWYEMVILYANLIKDRIENGEKLDAYEEMNKWTTMKAIEFTQSNNLKKKEEKLKLLRTEAQLIDLDINIRQSINIINPDTDACLLLLDQLYNLTVTPLMLKKHPEIVSNISKIRNYVGNIKSWDMTEDIQKVFEEKADQIRVKSEAVYTKFKAVFNVEKCESFSNLFSNEVEIFQQKTCSLNAEEILSLTEEPE